MLYAVLAALVFAGGCENLNELKNKIVTLTESKKQLHNELERAELENEQLKQQVRTLSELKPEVRLENVYNTQRIQITRYTGFYVNEKDGKIRSGMPNGKEKKLVVYFQPIDQDGDVIKATGVVDVELWDLNRPVKDALLGRWQMGPEELRKCWFATVLIINYRLSFDAPAEVDKIKGSLVVKVTFTDYLSGRVFEEQKVIRSTVNDL
jgi:hypothetical protein